MWVWGFFIIGGRGMCYCSISVVQLINNYILTFMTFYKIGQNKACPLPMDFKHAPAYNSVAFVSLERLHAKYNNPKNKNK